MKGVKMFTILVLALALMIWASKVSEADSMGTAWTYQGRLIDANNAADGPYDFEFRLYDEPVKGVQQGNTIEVNDLDVIDGYFTAELDFGGDVFNGKARWLDICVRPGDSDERYTILSPRQEVTPTPYAIYAENAGTDNDWMVAGNNMYSIPSGNIGIGTTSPTAPLTIKTTNGTDIEFTSEGNNADIMSEIDFRIGTTGSRPFNIITDNQFRLKVDEAGKVGIGTISPTAKLHVQDIPSPGNTIFAEAGSGTAVMGKAIGTGLNHNYGGWFEAAGTWGTGVYGKASNAAEETNYGGFFEAEGKTGYGIYSRAFGSFGVGVCGMALGTSGRGVIGTATNLGDVTNYGGHFWAYGRTGRGVYGAASGTSGIGVYGDATNAADVNSCGGYFKAQGLSGRGVYGTATGSNGVGVYGEATGGGKAGYFDGEVHTTGDITKAYTAGTSNRAAPIAYAFIDSDGTVASGTPNVASTWNAAGSRYEITISDESYIWSNYVTVVTVATGSTPRFATTNSVSGKLLVYLWDTAGSKVQEEFQFVTYKP